MTREVVTVRQEDLCTIAKAVGTMKHDLDNGKTKYLVQEIDRIHEVVERWATDESVLGGGCHDDHRFRLCQEYSPLPVPRSARRQQSDASQPVRGDSQHSDEPEVSAPLFVPENRRRRRGATTTNRMRSSSWSPSRIPSSGSHTGSRPGYFGVAKDWEAARPYTWTTLTPDADEVDGGVVSYSTPESALDPLCGLLLNKQHNEDSRRINPEQRKRAARKVLGEFLEELPD